MTEDRKFYVYLISRPDGRPCYVGKGHGKRMGKHSAKSTHNPHLARIYAKYGSLPVVKLREGLTEDEAFDAEIAIISAIGRLKNGGPLVNMTDGGEGVSGHVWSEELRKKFAGIKRTPEQIERLKLAIKNLSPEARAAMKEKQRAAKLGRKLSDETRAAMSRARIGKARAPSIGAKISAAKMGKKASEETKAILKAANRSRDPEVRERIRLGTIAANERKRGNIL